MMALESEFAEMNGDNVDFLESSWDGRQLSSIRTISDVLFGQADKFAL